MFVLLPFLSSSFLSWLLSNGFPSFIAILTAAYPPQAELQTVVNKYGSETDPALLFKLPNEIRSSATLFGFQKVYEGVWSFDIYFDSNSVLGSKLDC